MDENQIRYSAYIPSHLWDMFEFAPEWLHRDYYHSIVFDGKPNDD